MWSLGEVGNHDVKNSAPKIGVMTRHGANDNTVLIDQAFLDWL